MEKTLYYLVRFPWAVGIVVLLALAQAPLGPWYVSAWLVVGVSLMAVVLARAAKLRLAESVARHDHSSPPVPAVL